MCRQVSSRRPAGKTPRSSARCSTFSIRHFRHSAFSIRHSALTMTITSAPVFGTRDPDAGGYYGPYGGRFVPETLVAPIEELTAAYFTVRNDEGFRCELQQLLRDYVGRPTPLYEAKRLTASAGGARIVLKREDLAHTGAHKINNALGQALPAARMGKRPIRPGTGPGPPGGW